MASFIFALINSEGLLWSEGVHTENVCQFISSRSAARKKTLLLLVQPTHGEITSFIYHFLALFFQQIPGRGAISQERNPPYECVCLCYSSSSL